MLEKLLKPLIGELLLVVLLQKDALVQIVQDFEIHLLEVIFFNDFADSNLLVVVYVFDSGQNVVEEKTDDRKKN